MKSLPTTSAPTAVATVLMSVAGAAELWAAARALALDDPSVIARSGDHERVSVITTVGTLRRLHQALELCAIVTVPASDGQVPGDQ